MATLPFLSALAAASSAAPRPTTPPAPKPRRYSIPDAFFNRAIKDAIHDSIFSPVSLNEKHHVSLKPKFDTACWAYLPPHRIYIGTDLFEKRMVKPGLTEDQQAKYIANHYHHELGHALFTERNMKGTQASLKAMDCPFSLYNLFEDAYMEDRYRREAEYRFEWLTLEELDFNPRPESLLFALIQAEGDVPVVEKHLCTWKPEAPDVEPGDPMAMFAALFSAVPADTREQLQALLPRVVEYYRRIIAATHSMQLMPILKEWLAEFGQPPAMPNGGAAGAMSDLEQSAQLMTDEKALEDFEQDVEEIQSGGDSDEGKGGAKGKAEANPDDKAVAKKGTVLLEYGLPADLARAEALAAKFKKFFAEKSRVVSTRTPQRRVSARHFALDRAPYRRTEVEGRGCKNVFLVIDCSGSMRGFHIEEGKVLVLALSILARQGFIEGHVALSGMIRGPKWELYKLPMAKDIVDRISGHAGGEALEYTMRDHLKLIQNADFTFVYTDGQITDAAIDKAHFHRYGVYTWGLYAGTRQDFLPKLLTYFDKAILRDSVEALVDAMLVQQR